MSQIYRQMCQGHKNLELNNKIIAYCMFDAIGDKLSIDMLTDFHHTDTYLKSSQGVYKLQGYWHFDEMPKELPKDFEKNSQIELKIDKVTHKVIVEVWSYTMIPILPF